MSLGTSHRSQLRHTRSQAGHRAAVGRACFETLEDRRLLSFSPAVNYATNATASAVVTADFNNDGNLDLVTCANAETGSYSVFLGNGAGGFGAAQRTVIGSGLSSMAVADFNNDAKLDLVVSDYEGFRTLMGNGNGTFQPTLHQVYKTMAAVGDFNNDGNTDVLATWIDGDWATHFQVYRGDGQGGFAASAFDAYYWGWGATAAVDLDDDANLDVVTGEGVVFLGNGDGSFQFDWEQPLPNGGAIATGDFTGEGNADAIAAAYENVAVLRGRGDGTFHAPITYPAAAGTLHTGVATADFNGDGKLDAVVSAEDTGTVSLMLGSGDGTLRYAGAFATGTSPSGVVVGDFNGDGRPDAAVSNAGSRNVSVLLNDGDWSALPPPSLRVSDATVTEGNTGSTDATFTVSLSQAADADVTLQYSTANMTAVAGSDYAANSGTVTIPAGQTSATFTVAVTGDRLGEPTETFAVNLGAATNATVADAQGIGTILDNEPRISINNESRSEGGNKQSTTFTFTVSLSAAYDQAVTVNYATANGTATAGSDFTSKSGVVTFAAGETVKTITVTVKGDKAREANETFFVDLFGASGNALIALPRGIGTIFNDDR